MIVRQVCIGLASCFYCCSIGQHQYANSGQRCDLIVNNLSYGLICCDLVGHRLESFDLRFCLFQHTQIFNILLLIVRQVCIGLAGCFYYCPIGQHQYANSGQRCDLIVDNLSCRLICCDLISHRLESRNLGFCDLQQTEIPNILFLIISQVCIGLAGCFYCCSIGQYQYANSGQRCDLIVNNLSCRLICCDLISHRLESRNLGFCCFQQTEIFNILLLIVRQVGIGLTGCFYCCSIGQRQLPNRRQFRNLFINSLRCRLVCRDLVSNDLIQLCPCCYQNPMVGYLASLRIRQIGVGLLGSSNSSFAIQRDFANGIDQILNDPNIVLIIAKQLIVVNHASQPCLTVIGQDSHIYQILLRLS